MVDEERISLVLFYKGTNLIPEDATSMIWPPSKGPTSQYHHIGHWDLTYELWGHTNTFRPEHHCCWACRQMTALSWIPLTNLQPSGCPLLSDHTPFLFAACIRRSMWGYKALATVLQFGTTLQGHFSTKYPHGITWAFVVTTSEPNFSFSFILLSSFPHRSQEHPPLNFLQGNLVSESSGEA